MDTKCSHAQRGLMPIHVAAIQGQEAVVLMLIEEFHQSPSAKDSVATMLPIKLPIITGIFVFFRTTASQFMVLAVMGMLDC